MSAKREATVRVAKNEIKRLRKQAKRADRASYQNRMLKKQKQQKEQRLQKLDQVIRQQDNRARQYDKRLNGMGRDLKKMAQKQHRQFREQQQKFQRQLKADAKSQQAYTDRRISDVNKRIDQVSKSLSHKIEAQSRQFKNVLKGQEQRLQTNIDNLSHAIEQRLGDQSAMAREWLKSAREEVEFIKTHYRHALFAPGEAEAIERTISMAAGDSKSANYEAAIVTGRKGFLEAQKLREKLEYAEMEWEHFYSTAQETAGTALNQIEENRCYALKMDEFEEQEVELDVSYWSGGRWDKLHKRITDVCERLKVQKRALKTGELQGMIKIAVLSESELADLDEFSRNALLASVKRCDIQEQIHDKLAECGYHLVESTYEGDDHRGAYFMKMRNGSSEEIVTEVAPDTNGDVFTNRLTFNFFDNSPNEMVREERTKEIGRILEQEEISVSNLRCVPGYEHHNAPEETRSFELIRKRNSLQP